MPPPITREHAPSRLLHPRHSNTHLSAALIDLLVSPSPEACRGDYVR